MIGIIGIGIGAVAALGIGTASIVQVRPTERAMKERFGEYMETLEPGLHIIIPLVDQVRFVNITEQMVDVEPQQVITEDKLNAEVDAIVYYKVKDPKAALYNVRNHKDQLTALARTTLRSVLGRMKLSEANENREKINADVEKVLTKETATYGVDVLRVEIQKIEPPEDVQDAMNMVVKAEQQKTAAKDFALAAETEADGRRMAAIKTAQGQAEAITIVADAEAKKIKVLNEAANKYFVGNAQKFKTLEVTENAMKTNTKYVIDSKTKIINLLSDSNRLA